MNLVNAQEMQRKHPKTFEAPSREELDKLKIDDTVKVACCGERFWTIITKINGDNITAIVDNDLLYTDEHGFKYKDVITFIKDNIHSIF